MSAASVNEPLAVREAPASYVLETQLVRPGYKCPKGYKQTEVGVIPEDWEVTATSDACIKVQDGTHFSPRLGGNDYMYVTSKNIRFGYLDLSTAERIDAEEHRAIYKRCDVKRGDVLLTKDGANTGNAALNTLDEEFSLLSSVAFLRVNPNKHVPAYFLQQILVSQGQRQIQDAMSGNAITRLTLEKINKLRFPCPPTKAEQQAIAEALSDADALIEALEQLIAKKRHLKQGAMQELLTGKKRLPGFSGEWAVKRLDAVAEIRSGGTPSASQSEFWEGDILWCTPTDITALNGFKYLTQTARMITTQGLKASSAELIPAHSVVMTSRATIGECAINAAPVSTNQGFKNFVPFETTDGEFLYYLLQTKKQAFISLCSGSTFLEIGKTQLMAFEIELPKEKPEQTAIATLLSDMDTEIAALETRLAKTRALKQGMMHNLLTGRIRLL